MFLAQPFNTLLPLLPLLLALQTLASPILTLRARQPSQPVFGTERYRRSPSSGQLSAAEHLRARLPSPASLSLPQLYSATPRLRPILPPAPTFRQWDPVDPYRAFVEQELLEQPEQGGLQDSLDDAYYAEGPYEGRAANRMSTETAQSPFVISPGYLQYNPAVSAFRPAATSWRSQERWRGPPGDPVDDLEEEMRREEDAMSWGSPRWVGDDSTSDVEEDDEDLEAEEEAEAEAEAAAEEAERRRQAEEEAERAKTEGAFLRNLILAQRYREDALSQPESVGGIAGRKAYRLSGGSKRTAAVMSSARRLHQSAVEPDRAVRELELLAGKGPSSEKRSPAKGKAVPTTTTAPTQAPARSTSAAPPPASAASSSGGGVAQRGQKEVAVPRPASPPRRPPVESVGGGAVSGGKWGKEAMVAASSKGSVLEALERLLEQEREPVRHRPIGNSHLQKRFVSGEDIMLRQLNELKHA